LLGVVEQILVAGDDRLGTSFPGQRKEMVVLGISKDRTSAGSSSVTATTSIRFTAFRVSSAVSRSRK
jgi:hypothetical protein